MINQTKRELCAVLNSERNISAHSIDAVRSGVKSTKVHSMEASSLPVFGKPMRAQFLFADGYLPLNHGSYGTYPRSVHSAKMQWQEIAEQRPDRFMRKNYMGELNKCREIAAKVINASASDCVFVTNATTGVNEILRSLPWGPGDTILYYSTVYGRQVCG